VADVGGSHSDEDSDDADEAAEPCLDDYLRPPEVLEVLQPAVVYLTVPALPRG
jgi:hypothetical protein